MKKDKLRSAQRVAWLKAWTAPAAMTYRDSLTLGRTAAKDMELVRFTLMASRFVADDMVEKTVTAADLKRFAKAIIEGTDLESEAERFLARVVAPLLLSGKLRDAAKLQTLAQAGNRSAKGETPDGEGAPERMLRAFQTLRAKRRRLPTKKEVVALYLDDGGKAQDARQYRRHFVNLGLGGLPHGKRGPDREPRERR